MTNTAYREALNAVERGEDPSIPSYMVASETTNIANGNQTFLESLADGIESIPKFISLSLVSGANQLYNIPADVGNLLGGDFSRVETEDIIATLDSDLGEYYKEHQEGIDLVGFIASSTVPGMAGVKVLNAGQRGLQGAVKAGKFGTNMGRAMGLLAPNKKDLLAKAVHEVATNSSAASLTSRSALEATLKGGVLQNVYEAAAFETAVAATMFESPVLENQDFGDFITNIAFSAGVFGAIGGAIDATKIHFALKKAGNKAALEARPWTFIAETPEASSTYEALALDFEQLAAIPEVPTNLDPARIEFLKQSAKTKVERLNNKILTNLGKLSDEDMMVAETLHNTFLGAKKLDAQSAFIGMVRSSRLVEKNKWINRAEYLTKKVNKGTASLDEINEFSELTLNVSYAKAWGENAGVATYGDSPVVTQLVDTLTKGDKLIKVTPKKVVAGDKTYSFNLSYNYPRAGAKKAVKPFNILTAGKLEVNARYIWASKLAKFKPSQKKPLTVHVNDIPLMEKVLLELGDDVESLKHVRFKGLVEGETDVLSTGLPNYIAAKKIELANKLLNIRGEGSVVRGKPRSKETTLVQEEIAAIVNVKSKVLSGELKIDPTNMLHVDDMLAMQHHAQEYTKMLVDKGVRRERDGLVDIFQIPQNLKLTYNLREASASNPLQGVNNFVAENMVIIKEQQKLYQEGTRRAALLAGGEEMKKLPDITSGKGGMIDTGATSDGAGAGFLTAASANYGSLAALSENIGNITSRMITKAKTATSEGLQPLLYKLGNNKKAAIEWSTLNSRVRSIEGEYALNEAGDALEPAIMVRWRQAAADAAELGDDIPREPTIPGGMEARIELQSQEVRDLVKAHIEVNGSRTEKLAGIRTSQGVQFNRGADVFYPIPVDPKDYPYFALVTDESITSGNHHKTLFANTQEELDQAIRKLKENKHLRIRTKGEAEEYFKAHGDWDYEKTLNSNYLDTEVKRKGASASFTVATDPDKIITDTLKWHMQRETGLVREAVSAHYEVPFRELRRLGDEFTNVATSKFSNSSLQKYADDAVKNPFASYIKTALGIRNTSDYPFWTNVNTMADEALSKVTRRATAVARSSKDPEVLLEVNSMLEQAGYKGAAYDETMEIFANSGPARGALNTVIQKANSILATVVLRWDALNAVNNSVSANVLLGAEAKAVVRAIESGDKNAVGALAELSRIKVPGLDTTIAAPSKMIARAARKFNRHGEDFTFYKDNGFMTRISDQYKNVLDDITYRGNESVKSWGNRIDDTHRKLVALGDKGEEFTGNRLAEEFNRFVAADVMKQMTDVAVAAKVMSPQEQLAYINTFVNRTQGNYLAAQRPGLFQGPVGQAIGLFQTYQFNLMQQLLRHVGEGHAKDAMTLLGLQGTIHGMNGLPGFNALNTHLVGTASGNQEHRDAYDTVYGIAGKAAGDWIMYGAASNTLGLLHPDLKVNLYTRGDINPRHVTIVPTNPSSIPVIQTTGRFMANLFNTVDTLAQGGDIKNVLLQGLEHNGISRPLAGLAQTLQGVGNVNQASYSTSKRGNVIASNDLLSWANLGRVVGGKPLDEAIALDAMYRFKAYGLEDAKKRMMLGRAIKSTMIAGGNPTQEQIEEFAYKYAEYGGRQKEFASWFSNLYTTANTSQANKIQQSLNSPFTQAMQRIMGGNELRDFD